MDQSQVAASLTGLVPSAVQQIVSVVEQVKLARDTYVMRLHCPEVAEQIVPGQFFMIRMLGTSDPLLGRAFALYDTFDDELGRPAGVAFGYVVVGKLTKSMTQWQAGDQVEIWGPLGNGFPVLSTGHLLLVAGGIGQTPFLAVAREALACRTYGNPPRVVSKRPSKLTLCYGTRSSEYLAGLDRFQIQGLDVQVSTDDGTQGHHGFVTDLFMQSVNSHDPPDSVFCCGPEPMMKVVGKIAARHNIACWLSLESPMACGFGICFSCVVQVKLDDGSWDYRRTCVEGPVFAADRLLL